MFIFLCNGLCRFGSLLCNLIFGPKSFGVNCVCCYKSMRWVKRRGTCRLPHPTGSHDLVAAEQLFGRKSLHIKSRVTTLFRLVLLTLSTMQDAISWTWPKIRYSTYLLKGVVQNVSKGCRFRLILRSDQTIGQGIVLGLQCNFIISPIVLLTHV